MTNRKTAIVILAAGKGTRMKSDRAKVLHPLAGRPMINHVVAAAQTLDVETVAVVVGPAMEDVADAVAPIATVIQKDAEGTGHAVLCAKQALDGFTGDVLILFGDTPLLRPQTMAGILALLDEETPLAVLAMRVGRDNRYGRLVVDGDGNLTRIVEYADASDEEQLIDLCNSGLLAGRAEVLFPLLDGLSNDNAKGEYYLTDTVALAASQGMGCAYEVADEAELLGVNDRSDLARAEAVVQGRLREAAMADGVTMTDPFTVWLSFDTLLGRDVTIGPNVFFGPGVRVAEGAQIRAFSHLEGASVGENAVIGPYARLRPGANIGEAAKIGNFVEIKKTQIGPGAKVSHLTYLGDASVGADANIGAGTITCNYDGFSKFETRIGEAAFIGSNTALVAPVTIGEGAIIGAGSVITSDVEADALALTRSPQKGLARWAARFRKDNKKKAK